MTNNQTATAIRHRTGGPWYAAIQQPADFAFAGMRPQEIIWQCWEPTYQTRNEALRAANAELTRRHQAENGVLP